jgi:glycosyltransferase involved in cell wall biosynthesis
MSLLAKLLRVKHLYVSHGFSSAKDISGFFKKALMGVDSIVAVSEKVKDQLLEAGLPNVKVIYNAVPIPTSPKTPKNKGVPVVFGIAATLQEIKGIHIALEAIGLVKENLLLEIAGDIAPGGDKSYVDRIKAMADSRIRFLGWVDNIHEVMGNWDVLLVPSLAESFSLSAAEAMSMGIPVIASRIGGVQEVVADAGILVTPGSVNELAEAIKRLATEPETRLRMGIASRNRVQRFFSLEKQVGAYAELIEKLGATDK